MNIDEAIDKYAQRGNMGMQIEHVRRVKSIEDLGTGVVFILALWSGQCLVALRRLTEYLATDPTTPTRLLVLNADEVTEELIGELCHRPQGRGEAFWIKQGKVVGMLVDYDPSTWKTVVGTNNEMLSHL